MRRIDWSQVKRVRRRGSTVMGTVVFVHADCQGVHHLTVQWDDTRLHVVQKPCEVTPLSKETDHAD